jgi:hypothetical protein
MICAHRSLDQRATRYAVARTDEQHETTDTTQDRRGGGVGGRWVNDVAYQSLGKANRGGCGDFGTAGNGDGTATSSAFHIPAGPSPRHFAVRMPPTQRNSASRSFVLALGDVVATGAEQQQPHVVPPEVAQQHELPPLHREDNGAGEWEVAVANAASRGGVGNGAPVVAIT